MQIFGCKAYVRIPKQFRDVKSEKIIMIVYKNIAYRLWNVNERKVIADRDVVFNDNDFFYQKEEAQIPIRRKDEFSEDAKSITGDDSENETKEHEPIHANDISEKNRREQN